MTSERELTPVDVGILILEAVAVLHSRGHERIRVLPGMSSSGAHWRIAVTTAANMDDEGGYLNLREWESAFIYTTGTESEIAGTSVTTATTPPDIADVIATSLPAATGGDDPAYVRWYGQLMDLVHRYHALPVAYADYSDPADGWEIGWGGNIHMAPPPPTQSTTGPEAGLPQAFSPHVIEQIGWYVYALRNPLDGRVFYVGKGTGNRIFAHAEHAEQTVHTVMSQKLGGINSIHEAGQKVEAFTIRHGLATENLAYEIEASVIDTLRLLDADLNNEWFSLTSQSRPGSSSTRGLASAEVIASLYDAPTAGDITVPALLIKIPGLWTPTMSQHALYEATRQWWRIGPKRHKAKYAFAVNHGVIRSVYQIDSWEPGWHKGDEWVTEPQGEPPHRWRFSGNVDNNLSEQYRNTSVKHLYKPGEANPIRYLNC